MTARLSDSRNAPSGKVMLSFDVEAIYHIQAARHVRLSASDWLELAKRLVCQVTWLRRLLDQYDVQATFFWVGELAWRFPYLVRALRRDGHEIACHSWSHRSFTEMSPEKTYQDIEQNKMVLEDILGEPMRGFRAPSFSVLQETHWVIAILRDLGFSYDSSVYPVIHDRYGVARAPRTPFVAISGNAELLELPPATLQLGPIRLAIGGGGHFRLWPQMVCERGIRQLLGQGSYVMLYFHPWEFDAEQPRLPLAWWNRWRTYTGIGGMPQKLERLLRNYKFVTAHEAAKALDSRRGLLPRFILAS